MNIETRTVYYTRETKFDENTYPQLDGWTQSSVNSEVDNDDEYKPQIDKSQSLPAPIFISPTPLPIHQPSSTPVTSNARNTPITPSRTPKNPACTPKKVITPAQPTTTPINNVDENQQTEFQPPQRSTNSVDTVNQVLEQDVEKERTKEPTAIPIPFNSQNKKMSKHREMKLISERKLILDKRISKPNPKYALFCEPISYKQAMEGPDSEKWQIAMKEEISSLAKNDTWDIVPLPGNKKPIRCKWVYRIKSDENGNPVRYKARLVAIGSTQKPGVDFDEISSPVVRWETIRFVFNIAMKFELPITQCDVDSAYLHGKIDKEIYMTQPPGFFINDTLVCKLNKSIYGLKQSGKIWNDNLTDAIRNSDFQQTNADPCLFIKNSRNLVMIYVDDIIIVGDNTQLLQNLKTKFSIKIMEKPKMFLNIKLEINANQILFSQQNYIENILEKYHMDNCKPKVTPADDIEEEESEKFDGPYREVIGALIYLATMTRPDICFIVNYLARKMNDPTTADWAKVKRVLRYLKSTPTLKLRFTNTSTSLSLRGFCDADFGGDASTGRSTSGILILDGDNPISWKSKLQKATALSTMEAELYALVELVKELAWIIKIAEELKLDIITPIPIYVDNQSTIKFVQNTGSKFHTRAKHIRVKYKFISEFLNDKIMVLHYVNSEENMADILTKPLKGQKFTSCATRIMNYQQS